MLIRVVILLVPIALAFALRWAALRGKARVWTTSSRLIRLVLTITVASWWITWDLPGHAQFVQLLIRPLPDSVHDSHLESIFFWALPAVSLGFFLIFCYGIVRAIHSLRWSTRDLLRQAWWRLASLVFPLLMVSVAFDAIFEGRARGVAWLLGAGVVAKVSTAFLRRAEGLKFNTLKSGELRNRAFRIAGWMGVKLDRVYLVPAGKGHLTNAYGMSNAIALTDNLGKYLSKEQIDSTIAHELAHVKLKHARKNLLLVITLFSFLTVALFRLPVPVLPFKPLLQLAVILGPLLVMYYVSRWFEYSADREEVEFTGDPETAIRGLANLYSAAEAPVRCDPFSELFATHPSLARRAAAIAKAGLMPSDRLTQILVEVGLADTA